MKILFLSRWFPYPVNNGSKLRIYNLLRGLSKHHEVKLLSFADQPDVNPDLLEIRSLCSEVGIVPWREYDPQSTRAKLGLFRLQPRYLVHTYSGEMDTLIRQSLSKNKFDIIVASQLSMASYHPCFDDTPAIFEELELGQFHDPMLSSNGFGKRIRRGSTWIKIKWYLSRLIDRFHVCTVVSEREHDLFVQNFPKHRQKVNVIPNCIDFESYRGIHVEPKPNQIIFSGSFRYPANYDAMKWFIREVYPKILERMPDAQLIITGDHKGLPLPAVKNIILAGDVTDIKSLIAACSVSVAPLWAGGGTRLKILEAMALGTPVVATTKGAEGLGAQNGEHLLMADTAESFATCVLGLLDDEVRRQQLANNALRFVQDRFSWDTTFQRFLSIVETSAQKRYNPRTA